MSDQGLFIVIEGVDGAGKSTQFKKLAERLETEGYDFADFAFPRYDEPSSYFVRQYLSGTYGQLDEIGPYTASLFYALDRYEAAPAIREALREGKVVICDRFTGASMAHQGTKFAHAEERRGYFIWLDNLEFQMLGLPRPDKNFVLRVPPEIAEGQMRQSGKKRDLHEADSEHLKKATEVLDDMVQLFPKDFTRVDCVRSGKLLGIEQVHELLWQAVEPLLPPKPAKKPKPKKSELKIPTAPAVAAALPDLHPSSQYLSVPVGGISDLLASYLENDPNVSYLEQAAPSGDYVSPEGLDPLTRAKYQATVEKILETHAVMQPQLEAYLEAHTDLPRAEAGHILQAVLPLAVKTTVTLSAHATDLETIIERLQAHDSEEADFVGAQLLAEARQLIPAMKTADLRLQGSAFASQAESLLQATHSTPTETVRLTAVWPRNELDLVPHMLYETSSLSLQELEQQVADWPIARKTDLFEAYLRERPSGTALEQVRYTWELLADYQTFRALQRSGAFEQLEAQPLTPRYGYDVPHILEEAGLDEAYEHCFDLSAKLYSVLQEAGFSFEAQYATLFGHRTRFKLTHTAQDTASLLKAMSFNAKLAEQIHQKLSEMHPLLAQIAILE